MGYQKISLRKFDLDQCYWHAESALDAALIMLEELGCWMMGLVPNQHSKVVSTHLWNTPLNLYQQVVKGIL